MFCKTTSFWPWLYLRLSIIAVKSICLSSVTKSLHVKFHWNQYTGLAVKTKQTQNHFQIYDISRNIWIHLLNNVKVSHSIDNVQRFGSSRCTCLSRITYLQQSLYHFGSLLQNFAASVRCLPYNIIPALWTHLFTLTT